MKPSTLRDVTGTSPGWFQSCTVLTKKGVSVLLSPGSNDHNTVEFVSCLIHCSSRYAEIVVVTRFDATAFLCVESGS